MHQTSSWNRLNGRLTCGCAWRTSQCGAQSQVRNLDMSVSHYLTKLEDPAAHIHSVALAARNSIVPVAQLIDRSVNRTGKLDGLVARTDACP
jgi:hypothetical protein